MDGWNAGGDADDCRWREWEWEHGDDAKPRTTMRCGCEESGCEVGGDDESSGNAKRGTEAKGWMASAEHSILRPLVLVVARDHRAVHDVALHVALHDPPRRVVLHEARVGRHALRRVDRPAAVPAAERDRRVYAGTIPYTRE